MKNRTKIVTAAMLSVSMITPGTVMASDIIQNSKDIDITLDTKSVFLGDTSNVSIKFNEDLNSETITLNQVCVGTTLDTVLTYNEQTKAYEGTITYNKSPEELFVWSIDSITINSAQPKVITKEELKKQGLNIDEYDVILEYIVKDYNDLQTYAAKTSVSTKTLAGETRMETAVEISKEGWPNGADKVIIVNGYSNADGITATPLATAMNAPILLTDKNSVPSSTLAQIKKLNPKDIIIIGGTNAVGDSVKNQLINNTNASVQRIGGEDRHQTSLKIAKELNHYNNIDKVYLANGYAGEVDALTIASKAGQDKQPIILTNKNEIPKDTYNWLKNERLKTGYVIGGRDVISTEVMHQLNEITSDSIYENRVYGSDRHQTNAAVIKRFYTQEHLNSMFVARSDELVDALTAGPLAAKQNSPILITPAEYVSSYHKENLDTKTANKVYKVGDVVKDKVITEIAYKLSKHNNGQTTVVIDPGHGGKDPGAVRKDKDGKTIAQEKDYVLDTSKGTGEYLRSQGINVIYTRETDKTIDVRNRPSMVNAINPDLALSIHYNSHSSDANGVEVWYQKYNSVGKDTLKLSNNIITRAREKFTQLKNRGPKSGKTNSGKDSLIMLRETNVPTVLVECGFLSSDKDLALFDTLAERKLFGTQVGKGVVDTLEDIK